MSLDVRERAEAVDLRLEDELRVVEGLRNPEEAHGSERVMLRSYLEPSASDSSARGGGILARKTAGSKKGAARKRGSSKRELIDTGRNKMFAKRTASGRFKSMDDVSRSLRADRRTTAKRSTKSGFGDQGDRKRATKRR